ncbi:MAG: hypothetical protein SGILL_004675 [Bacillariaceae sp.]
MDSYDTHRLAKRRRLYVKEDDKEDLSNVKTADSNHHFELCWTPSDEICTYSDHTLVVQAEGDDSQLQKSFSVHKAILAPKSKYFETLFRQRHFCDSGKNTSRLVFPSVVVEHFETFLDVCYMKSLNMENGIWKDLDVNDTALSEDNVSVLLFLFDYLGMECYIQMEIEDIVADKRDLAVLNELDIEYIWNILVGLVYSCLLKNGRDCSEARDYLSVLRDANGAIEFFKRYIAKELDESYVCHLAAWTLDHYKVDLPTFLTLTSDKYLPSWNFPIASRILDLFLVYKCSALVNSDETALDSLRRLMNELICFFGYHFLHDATLSKFDDFVLSNPPDNQFLSGMLCYLSAGYLTMDENFLNSDDSGSRPSVADVRNKLVQTKRDEVPNVLLEVISAEEWAGCGAYEPVRFNDGPNITHYLRRCKRQGDHDEVFRIMKFHAGTWELEVDDTVKYVNRGDGCHPVCPPFQGWKCADSGDDAGITISF